MSQKIKKITYKTSQITSDTDEQIFLQTNDFVDNLNTDSHKSFDGKKITYIFNKQKDRELIEKIDPQFISTKEKRSIRYHNFPIHIPSQDTDSNYFFEIKRVQNKNYDLTDQFSNITKCGEIKNFYTFGTELRADMSNDLIIQQVNRTEVKNYYSERLQPLQEKKIFLVMPDTVDAFNSSPVKSYIPEYNIIKIPSIQGIIDNTLLSDISYICSHNYEYAKIQQNRTVLRKNFRLYNLMLYNILSVEGPPESINFSLDKITPFFAQKVESCFKTNINPEEFNKKEYFSEEKKSNLEYIENPKELLEDYIRDNFNSKKIIYDIFTKQKTRMIPLFYKIQKLDEKNNSLEQEIYIPINYELNGYDTNLGTEYIDSQILPNKHYKYNLSIIAMSSGYMYDIIKDKPTGAQTTISYSVTPNNIKPDNILITLPIFKNITVSREKTYPAIPEALITSISDDANSIKIFLSTRIADERYINIEGTDDSKVLKPDFIFDPSNPAISNSLPYASSQYKDFWEQEEDQIRSFSNTYFKNFYIYRIENKPYSYNDFLRGKINIFNRNNTEFYDMLENNKKYYYIFRSHDGKNFSNPSSIYEVELKNFNGSFVPSIKTFEFEEIKKEQIKSLKFAKRISIAPAWSQLVLKELEEFKKSFDVGTDKYQFDRSKFLNLQSVFSNDLNQTRYKIRIRSKSSGKIVDINLKFRYVVQNLVNENSGVATKYETNRS